MSAISCHNYNFHERACIASQLNLKYKYSPKHQYNMFVTWPRSVKSNYRLSNITQF